MSFSPIIPLIFIDDSNAWICGRESGELVTATQEFLDYAIEDAFSKKLTRHKVPGGPAILDMPTTPGVSGASLERETITLVKCIVDDKYVIHVGFGPRSMVWMYHDEYSILTTYSKRER
jgi:hypothetical protein